MEDVWVVVGVVVVVEPVEQLRVILAPAKQGVIHAVVDSPLDPVHVGRLLTRHDSDAVAGMWWQQVTHTLCAKVGSSKDDAIDARSLPPDVKNFLDGLIKKKFGIDPNADGDGDED